MDILGIDVGTVSVKYTRWRGKKDKGELVSKGDYPYQGDLDNLAIILSDIKIREGGNIETALSITSQDILKKTFTIPTLPKEEIKEAINWSASKIVPMPLEEMVYEFVLLGEIDERGIRKEEVMFVGVQRDYVNNMLTLLDRTGFKDIVLITDVGFIYTPIIEDRQDGSVAVVDIGGRQTGIYILNRKKLRFVREIMTASESFTDVLISGLGVSYDEAEEYKREKGFDDRSNEILSLPFERLIGEMQRTFSVYNQKSPDMPIVKVYISGRGSMIPNIIEKIGNSLVEEVGHLEMPVNIDDEFLPAYVLCTRKESLVNLLPPEIKIREKEAIYKKWIRTGTIGILALLIILSLNVWSNYSKPELSIKLQKVSILNKQAQLKQIGGTISPSRYDELVPLLSETQKKDKTFVLLLKYLSSHLPKDVFIREIDFAKERQIVPSSKDLRKDASSQETMQVKDAVKETVKESTQKETTNDGAPKDLVQTTGPAFGNDYIVGIKGYIYGEAEMLEPILLSFIIMLDRSGFIQNVKVSSKELKEIGNGKVMEFVITGRCSAYEI
ncbi:MAG: pilus assembly protein PilM [Proteobacteria bacterium]|nr:pilus assembly protein PilM [Pseudomonadota bacterium]